MDLFGIYTDFVKEVLSFRNYRRMSVLKAILSALVVIPFIIGFIFLMLIYGLILIMYKFINAPTDFLYSFLKQEGKEVKHGTQAVMYLIAFPLIFMLKVIFGMLILILFFVHMFATLIGFVATLGGITFSPFLLDPADRKAKRSPKPFRTSVTTVFVTIGLILFVLVLSFAPVANRVNQAIWEDAPDRALEECIQRITTAKRNGTVPNEAYLIFYNDYTAGEITTTNYQYYNTLCLGLPSTYEAEALLDYDNWIDAIADIDQILSASYVLFVVLYVVIAYRSKKLSEEEYAALCAPAECANTPTTNE